MLGYEAVATATATTRLDLAYTGSSMIWSKPTTRTVTDLRRRLPMGSYVWILPRPRA